MDLDSRTLARVGRDLMTPLAVTDLVIALNRTKLIRSTLHTQPGGPIREFLLRAVEEAIQRAREALASNDPVAIELALKLLDAME
jgi:hypothetical protein